MGKIMANTAKTLTIAIDGPAGAGKSTTARMLSQELGCVYVDSGAMYRAVAWKCRRENLAEDNPDSIAAVARALDIRFVVDSAGGQRILADGEDVTESIRTPEISRLASAISTIPAVRELLVAKQRLLGQSGCVVMEGRDIGTVVFPDANVKVFLTASLTERARRRLVEMEQKGATGTNLDEVRKDIAERDERDSTRAISPLMPAPGAVIIDSEDMTARQVVDSILDLCSKHVKP